MLNIKNPASAHAVTSTLEALSTTLRTVAEILPNMGSFPIFEDIERGISIPAGKIFSATGTTFGFGIPLIFLTYMILKRKEVAP